jgi:hypothetical protein
MQKHLVLSRGENESELEALLKDGWKVVSTCPMPSSVGNIEDTKTSPGNYSYTPIVSYPPTCLVILENKYNTN